MKELSLKELNDVIQEIQMYHKFAYIDDDIVEKKKIECHKYSPKLIKYIDISYDTREDECGCWSITFRNGSLNYTVDDKTKSSHKTMYEHICSWLNGEIE